MDFRRVRNLRGIVVSRRGKDWFSHETGRGENLAEFWFTTDLKTSFENLESKKT